MNTCIQHAKRIIDRRYELEALISHGGMGSVYKARRIIDGKRVAIKLIRAHLENDSAMIKQFQREIHLARLAHHEHICEVIDWGMQQGGSLYLVMPLLEGATLATLLKQKPPLTHARVINIMCQILLALSQAHRLKIVYRDLKPSNIFVTRDRHGNDLAKLLDFGVSMTLESATTRDTQQDIPIGTSFYMAPEQTQQLSLDHRADIYAAGVVLYEALTGQLPFVDASTSAVMRKITVQHPKSPRRLNPSISKDLESIVLKAMARLPAERYATADDMYYALQQTQGQYSLVSSARTTTSITVQDMTLDNFCISPKAIKILQKMSEQKRILGLIGIAGALIGIIAMVAIWLFSPGGAR